LGESFFIPYEPDGDFNVHPPPAPMEYGGLVAILDSLAMEASTHAICYQASLVRDGQVKNCRQGCKFCLAVAADKTESLVCVTNSSVFNNKQALANVTLGLKKGLVEVLPLADFLG